ncbi:uncharacterized protein V1513DRAFT_289531 [Lipomyces chichibuensis]|uniref:uncharacterized protein n=1 Tax=Lipomyces chichibuensis TaxID=1546026 RepID=UPI0033434821
MAFFPPIDSLSQSLSLSDLEPLESLAQCVPIDDANVSRYYSLFIYCLIINDDIEEARFLLKRASTRTISADSAEVTDTIAPLSTARRILTSLWTKNYVEFFSTVEAALHSVPLESPEANLLRTLADHVREANYKFVSRAFLSGALSDIAVYFGISEIDAKEFLVQKGWSVTDELTVKAPAISKEPTKAAAQQKARFDSLTSLITHMQRA